MKFFVPDWDDRVDPGYDFLTDRFSLIRNPYVDDVYAHELFDDPIYDGVLVSRMALEGAGPKRELVDRIGMRKYLRLPSNVELLGDCGAFGYVGEKEPRFETSDVIDYYDRLGFDYGVSVDHLIVQEFAAERAHRYEITLRNARQFLATWQQGKYHFTPVGAIQGWDIRTYVEAARALVQMGYDYIAIGGLARSNTQTVGDVVAAVRETVPANVRIHVFGVARLALLSKFIELNVTSVDSAAPLRQAWLSAVDNYYTLDRTYAAIRVPVVREERSKNQTLIGRSPALFTDLERTEGEALTAIRAYDSGATKLQAALDAIMAYDDLLAKRAYGHSRERRRMLYRETLQDRPWKRCPCSVCQQIGVEVIMFRGNNRNRRRGFHNLWMLRQRIDRLPEGHSSNNHRLKKLAAPIATNYLLPTFD
jgi:Queuine tRNA-ribosyltransferase